MHMDNNDQVSGTPPWKINPQRRISDWLRLGVLILTGIFIFVNPVPHTTAIAEISFYLTVAILLVLLCGKQMNFTLKTPLTIPFGLFLIWGLFDLFFAINKANSIHDIYAHLVKYLFFFYVLVNFFASREKFLYLIWIVIISSTVFAAGQMIYDYIILGRDISMKLGLYSSTEMPSNIVGIITIFALLLSLFHLKEEKEPAAKIILVVCLCILALATLATQTRGALIALLASLILSFFGNRKIVATVSLLILLAVLFLPVKNVLTASAIQNKVDTDLRLQIWRMYGEIVKDHPLTGIGFGMQTYYDEHLLARYNAQLPPEHRPTQLYKAPHNLLVDIAVRLGLVGLFLFLYIIFAFVRMGIKAAGKGRNDFIRDWEICLMAAFTAFFIQGLMENVLSGPPAIVLYTILGMMTILWHLHGETPEPV